MSTKLLCGILCMLLLGSLALTVHVVCKYTKSYQDDFSREEKEEIRRCLKEMRDRDLICGKYVRDLDHLLVKWEIVSGLADEKE